MDSSTGNEFALRKMMLIPFFLTDDKTKLVFHAQRFFFAFVWLFSKFSRTKVMSWLAVSLWLDCIGRTYTVWSWLQRRPPEIINWNAFLMLGLHVKIKFFIFTDPDLHRFEIRSGLVCVIMCNDANIQAIPESEHIKKKNTHTYRYADNANNFF